MSGLLFDIGKYKINQKYLSTSRLKLQVPSYMYAKLTLGGVTSLGFQN